MRLLLLSLGLALPAFAGPSPVLFDNAKNKLADEDFMRLTRAGYKLTPEGRVLRPATLEPIEAVEMPRLLDELESRQRLEAMLALNLIFSRFGYKDLPPEPLEEVRRLGRQNWRVFSASLRADLKPYFTGAELEAMDQGVPKVRMPRTWLPEEIAPPTAAELLDAGPSEEPEPAASGRPLSVAETMPTTPLPAPWTVTTSVAAPPRPTPQTPAPLPPPPPLPTDSELAAARPAALPAPPLAAAPPAPVSPATQAPAPPPAAVAKAPAAAAPAAAPPAPIAPAPLAAPVAAPPASPPATLLVDGAAVAFPGRVLDRSAGVKQAAPPAAPKPPPPATPAPAAAAPPAPAPPAVEGPPKPVEAPVPPPLPAEPARAPFAEYSHTSPEAFAKFLADAPYGHEAHHLLQLLSRHADAEDRRISLGVLQRHIPAVLIDAARAGVALRSAAVLPPGDLGVGKAIFILHPGPVVARRRKVFSSELAFVPENQDFYAERGLAVPALDATAAGATTAKEEDGDWGRARVYDDGSRRLRPSPEQLAGTLLELLLRLDARARGWQEAYRGGLRARAAQFRFYRRVAAETGSSPRLDRALAAEYTEWLNRPLDWADHWAQALAAPASGQLAPSLSGALEERLRTRNAVEARVLASIGLAPERTAPGPEGSPDEFMERERQVRIDRELKALSDGGPEARAWVAAERRFRKELSGDAR